MTPERTPVPNRATDFSVWKVLLRRDCQQQGRLAAFNMLNAQSSNFSGTIVAPCQLLFPNLQKPYSLPATPKSRATLARQATARPRATTTTTPLSEATAEVPNRRHTADEMTIPTVENEGKLIPQGVHHLWTPARKNDRVPSEWTPSPGQVAENSYRVHRSRRPKAGRLTQR